MSSVVPSELGRTVFKNNCLFCHSIHGLGGNKGGSLLEKFNFQLDIEKHRFKDAFYIIHEKYVENKQNIKQFLAPNDLKALSTFLSEMSKVR